MKVTMLACAETIITDAATNRVSLVNLIDDFSSPAFPVIIPSLSVFVSLVRAHGQADPQANLKITLDDQVLLDAGFAVAFQDLLRNRSTVNIRGMAVPQPGTLRFEVRFNGVLADTFEIVIDSAGTQIAAPSSSAAEAAETTTQT